MLRVASKGSAANPVALAPEEDRILRAAFGRYAGRAAAREAAVPIVRRYQQLGAGSWFLCDCRPGAERPPALVPVAQRHIRRHQDDRWPVHCDGCDFQRDPAEQRALVASYTAAAAARPLRLVRALGAGSAAMRPGTVGNSQDANRPGVARLLARLVTDAGLQTVGAAWRAPMLIDQVKAIWTAARQLDLDVGVSLPDFLCTSPAKFGELVQRIEQAPARRFTHSRPHGVLIVRAAAVGAGLLQPVAGEPIAVLGRLAVFGERAEPGREGRAERAARAPYLAACVVGRAEEGGPVQVLSAYAHPCAGDAHWMLLDSDMERRTLEQLRSVQAWLGTKKGLQVVIEKPVFDIGGDAEAHEAPRPPCIPDFLVRAAGADGARTTVIAETMGFANQEYRQRKDRTHAAMVAAVGNGAPVVLHDFHEPAEQPQAARDARFWRDMRWALTGPDLASPGQRS